MCVGGPQSLETWQSNCALHWILQQAWDMVTPSGPFQPKLFCDSLTILIILIIFGPYG